MAGQSSVLSKPRIREEVSLSGDIFFYVKRTNLFNWVFNELELGITRGITSRTYDTGNYSSWPYHLRSFGLYRSI